MREVLGEIDPRAAARVRAAAALIVAALALPVACTIMTRGDAPVDDVRAAGSAAAAAGSSETSPAGQGGQNAAADPVEWSEDGAPAVADREEIATAVSEALASAGYDAGTTVTEVPGYGEAGRNVYLRVSGDGRYYMAEKTGDGWDVRPAADPTSPAPKKPINAYDEEALSTLIPEECADGLPDAWSWWVTESLPDASPWAHTCYLLPDTVAAEGDNCTFTVAYYEGTDQPADPTSIDVATARKARAEWDGSAYTFTPEGPAE